MKITDEQRAEWVEKYGPDLGHWYNSEGRCDSCDCRWGGGWSKDNGECLCYQAHNQDASSVHHRT